MHLFRHLLIGLALAAGVAVLSLPANAFATGSPLRFTIDPATVRQKSGKEFTRVSAIVTLREPSPAYFICVIRSQDGDKISFPAIIFHKDEQKAIMVGTVYWKLVRRETRLRITAFNSDAPDRRLTFTVALVPAEDRGITQ